MSSKKDAQYIIDYIKNYHKIDGVVKTEGRFEEAEKTLKRVKSEFMMFRNTYEGYITSLETSLEVSNQQFKDAATSGRINIMDKVNSLREELDYAILDILKIQSEFSDIYHHVDSLSGDIYNFSGAEEDDI